MGSGASIDGEHAKDADDVDVAYVARLIDDEVPGLFDDEAVERRGVTAKAEMVESHAQERF